MKTVPLIRPAGEKISPADLQLSKAKAFLQAAKESVFSEVQELIKDDLNRETIIIKIQVEVPQYPKYDIQKEEHIAVSFDPNDTQIPRVYTLREDFPSLPHQLLELNEKPRSLCLYDIPYDEIKIFWTAPTFLERIREWLKLSAVGDLHQKDQPLEPLFLYDDGYVFLDGNHDKNCLNIYIIDEKPNGKLILLASSNPSLNRFSPFPVRMEYIKGEPQLHGIVQRAPQNLLVLAQMLKNAGIELVTFLTEKLKDYKRNNVDLTKRLAFLIDLPKLRNPDCTTVEAQDSYVFLTTESIEEIGIRLNLWDNVDRNLGVGYIIGQTIKDDALVNTPIGILRPVYPYNRQLAQFLNGVEETSTPMKIMAVGAGALGSQLILNLIRAGIGQWTVIDSDILLPHNLSRHALTYFNIMRDKAKQFAIIANGIIPECVSPIVGNIIEDIQKESTQKAIRECELLLEISASSAALKSISAQPHRGRICSCSLSPSGNDFVAFCEDKERNYNAAQLEIQYLRFILKEPYLHDHFNNGEQKFRYGTGCRDVSLVLPQDSVAIAAAIGSKMVKQKILKHTNAFLSIWRVDNETGTVCLYDTEVFKSIYHHSGDWTIYYDEYLINKLSEKRSEKLPNETGGILIGNYDMERQIVYIADTIDSPSDSIEYPQAYIRGINGVSEELKKVEVITAGALQYIGEWHSHPKGYSTVMSGDDKILLSWLRKHMNSLGLPPLMLIVGDNKKISFYIN
ncbi:ThiF family protein [Chitinophaga niastensis]|uniref:ThiF family protein n=1 Tax=Chitinophaga niastensis TaxID=536980 RepID=A0A2P8HFI8_CHINA|nr:ThiF family adenylyltransferase [Chitinophaga niastensis]PSL44975.1 ThiF family protein [Chitinophaga niastensis]